MIDNDVANELVKISEKIIREAIKILEEKKPEEYTEEDIRKIIIAHKISKIVKKRCDKK